MTRLWATCFLAAIAKYTFDAWRRQMSPESSQPAASSQDAYILILILPDGSILRARGAIAEKTPLKPVFRDAHYGTALYAGFFAMKWGLDPTGHSLKNSKCDRLKRLWNMFNRYRKSLIESYSELGDIRDGHQLAIDVGKYLRYVGTATLAVATLAQLIAVPVAGVASGASSVGETLAGNAETVAAGIEGETSMATANLEDVVALAETYSNAASNVAVQAAKWNSFASRATSLSKTLSASFHWQTQAWGAGVAQSVVDTSEEDSETIGYVARLMNANLRSQLTATRNMLAISQAYESDSCCKGVLSLTRTRRNPPESGTAPPKLSNLR